MGKNGGLHLQRQQGQQQRQWQFGFDVNLNFIKDLCSFPTQDILSVIYGYFMREELGLLYVYLAIRFSYFFLFLEQF